jgi:hypothetical protein
LNIDNEDYFLVKEVRRLEQMGPGLQRYEKLKKQYRDDMLSLTELEQIYKATCEDLERLRHIERNTLEGSLEMNDSESDESTSFYQMLQQQRRKGSFTGARTSSKFSGGVSSE